MDDNLQELVDLLNTADLVVAFNNIDFDNPLLAAEAKNQKLERLLRPDLPNYDMLVESRKGAGVDKFTGGFKLDAHLDATFGKQMLKTADGSEAPKMFQRKELGRLASYCLADVRRERALFESVWATGVMKNSSAPAHKVKTPQEVLRAAGFDVFNASLRDDALWELKPNQKVEKTPPLAPAAFREEEL